jgi:hypothetical protein
VKIRFKTYDQRVLPEMGAKIAFLPPGTADAGAPGEAVLTVPAAAVATRNGQQVVFQVKEDRAIETPVVVGRRLGNLMEIKQGLKEGDKVIGKIEKNIDGDSKITVKNK